MRKGLPFIGIVIGFYLLMLLVHAVIGTTSEWGNLYWILPMMAGGLYLLITSFNKQ